MFKRASIQFIATILLGFIFTISAYAQNPNCGGPPKVTGKAKQADIENLSKMIPGYLAAYAAGDVKAIASYINKKRVNKIANRFFKKHANEKSRVRHKDINIACAKTIEVFDTMIYARIEGQVGYKAQSGKQHRQFYFYVRKKDGGFQFSDMQFLENAEDSTRQ